MQLTASDGHEFDAYMARPEGEPIAGLVVVQEIFGINAHIRSVADGYAHDGFLAVAPALFDRIEKHVDLKYEGEDMQKAMSFSPKMNMGDALDETAALDYARKETGKKIGMIGYCFGGTVAWLSATRLKVDAAVGYYARLASDIIAEATAKAPVMLHFGKLDTHIPKEDIDRFRRSIRRCRFPGMTPITDSTAMHGQVMNRGRRNWRRERSLAISDKKTYSGN